MAIMFSPVFPDNMPFKRDVTGGYAGPGGEITFKVKPNAALDFGYKFTVIVVDPNTGAYDVLDPKFIVKG